MGAWISGAVPGGERSEWWSSSQTDLDLGTWAPLDSLFLPAGRKSLVRRGLNCSEQGGRAGGCRRQA